MLCCPVRGVSFTILHPVVDRKPSRRLHGSSESYKTFSSTASSSLSNIRSEISRSSAASPRHNTVVYVLARVPVAASMLFTGVSGHMGGFLLQLSSHPSFFTLFVCVFFFFFSSVLQTLPPISNSGCLFPTLLSLSPSFLLLLPPVLLLLLLLRPRPEGPR